MEPQNQATTAQPCGAALRGAPGLARWVHQAPGGAAAGQLRQALWPRPVPIQPFSPGAPRADPLLRAHPGNKASSWLSFGASVQSRLKYLPPCKTRTPIIFKLLNMCLLEYMLQENSSVYTAIRRKEPRWRFGKSWHLSNAAFER